MSCYICDKETMKTVLKAWLMCKNIHITTQEELNKAWEQIVYANYDAYTHRYGIADEPDIEDMPSPLTIEDWFCGHNRPSKAERYSALREYMYQCAEGDYHKRAGYYKSQWCLDAMLEDYIKAEFPDAKGWGLE